MLYDASQTPPVERGQGEKQSWNRNLTSSEKPSTLTLTEPEPSPKRGRRQASPEVAEFLALPPQLQKQVLRYGERWWDGVSR